MVLFVAVVQKYGGLSLFGMSIFMRKMSDFREKYIGDAFFCKLLHVFVSPSHLESCNFVYKNNKIGVTKDRYFPWTSTEVDSLVSAFHPIG